MATTDMQPAHSEAAPQTITLQVGGMTCASCALRVEKGLKKVPGVRTRPGDI
jgi:Cu+-exporting ATPase